MTTSTFDPAAEKLFDNAKNSFNEAEATQQLCGMCGPAFFSSDNTPTLKFEIDWPSFRQIFLEQFENDNAGLATILNEFTQKKLPQLINRLALYVSGQFFKQNTSDEATARFAPVHAKFFSEHVPCYTLHGKEAITTFDELNGKIVLHESLDFICKKNNIQWIHQNFNLAFEEMCLKYHFYMCQNFLVPEIQLLIKAMINVTQFKLEVDWSSIKADAVTACVSRFCSRFGEDSLYRLLQAYDEIVTNEPEHVLDQVATNIKRLVISHGAKKMETFDIQTDTVYITLVFDSELGYFDVSDYVACLKYAGLYKAKEFPIELISSAASLYTTQNGDTQYLKETLDRSLIWAANDEEEEAFEACAKLIAQQNEKSVEKETTLCCWHVLKYAKNNLSQERILYLTDKAYYFFDYDFGTKKAIDKYKRLELFNLGLIETGETVCKLYSFEKRRPTIINNIKKVTAFVSADDEDLLSSMQMSPRPSSHILRSAQRGSFINRRSGSKISKEESVILNDSIYKSISTFLQAKDKRMSQRIDKKDKPSTADLHYQTFCPFDPIKTKKMIDEIAWAFYGAAAVRTGSKILEPFVGHAERSLGFLHSLLYNKLQIGYSSRRNNYVPSANWVETANPLYKMEYDEEPDDAIQQSAELIADENQRKMSKYKVLQRIAAGNEGSIYLAVDKSQNKKVALKAIQYSTKEQIAAIDEQVKLVTSFVNKNVVRHYDTFTTLSQSMSGEERTMFLVMDFCETSLDKMLEQDNIPDEVKQEWLHQIIQSVSYLHRQNVIHRDIKAENILLNTHDDKGVLIDDMTKWKVKICDFGSATKVQVDEKSVQKKILVKQNTVVGTPLFMAPEVMMMKGYDFSADIWSLGIVTVQLILNKPAAQMPNVFQQISRHPEYIESLLIDNPSIDPVLMDIARSCCKLDPVDRPTTVQLMKKHFKAYKVTNLKKVMVTPQGLRVVGEQKTPDD